MLNRWLSTTKGLISFCAVLTVVSLSSFLVAWEGLHEVGLADTASTQFYKYEPVCSSSDNIAEQNFGMQRCAEDIDVVYTWVNGSDPIWYQKMSAYKHRELMRRKYVLSCPLHVSDCCGMPLCRSWLTLAFVDTAKIGRPTQMRKLQTLQAKIQRQDQLTVTATIMN